MPISLEKLGYGTIYQKDGPIVALPDELTSKWWDKKKGTAAKIKGGVKGGTGMTEALDALKVAFEKLPWVSLGANPNNFEAEVDSCKSFVTCGLLREFREQLKTVREIAKEESKEMAKSVLTKGTAKVLDEIYDAADAIYVATNSASLSNCLDNAIEAWEKNQIASARKSAGNVVSYSKAVVAKSAKVLNEIDELQKKFKENPEGLGDTKNSQVPLRTLLGNAIRTYCRDCTTQLGNIVKADKAGVVFKSTNMKEVEKLNKTMSRISGTKDPSEFMDKLNPDQTGKLVGMVKGWAGEYAVLVKDIEVGLIPTD